MTFIGYAELKAGCYQLADICLRENACAVIVIRSDGTFQITDPNPAEGPLPADKDECPAG